MQAVDQINAFAFNFVEQENLTYQRISKVFRTVLVVLTFDPTGGIRG